MIKSECNASSDAILYLHMQSFFAERFFHLFDKDMSGYISLRELLDGLTLLTSGSEVDKLHFLFQVYDVDGNTQKLLYSLISRLSIFGCQVSNGLGLLFPVSALLIAS